MEKIEYISPEVEISVIPPVLTSGGSGELGEDELPYSPFEW